MSNPRSTSPIRTMNRPLIISGVLLLLSISGCATVTTSTPTDLPQPATQTLAPVTQATSAPLDTTTSPPPTQTNIPAELVPEQRFSRISYTEEPEYFTGETIFPLGIQEIFVIWHYEDMQPGDAVRWIWLHDDTIWVQGEEVWDYDKDGSSGRMTGISIFDHSDGLPAGNWELQLYVNDVLQMDAESISSFSIELIRQWETWSPDGSRLAWVENKRALIVDGETIATADPDSDKHIGRFDWYPDSQHLLYTEIMRPTEETDGPYLSSYKLWVVDIVSGDRELVSGEADYIHTPVISPDGEHAAVILGRGYGDACGVDWALGIVSIHADLTLGDPLRIRNFSGFADVFDSVYLVNPPDHKSPGMWEDAENLIVALNFTCTAPGTNLPGIYRINITDQTVDKISDLPPE